MRCQVKSKMKREFITGLLVFGLVSVAHSADDNVVSETQESGSSIIRFLDKNKRGAAKITNTDSPSFNHLTTSSNADSSNGAFKPVTGTSNQSPPYLKYFQNEQNYQPNPYVTYIQIPQTSQIASQYSFQSNPVAHFLQTPTQLQYVATPTIAQIPQIKYQSFSAVNPSVSELSSSATNAQYISQSQQSTASTNSQASASNTVTQPKQVQLPLSSDYQTAQQVYYTQQPLFTYYPQAQAANFIYQQPNANFVFRQQQQQLANIYGSNRFGFYTPTQHTQLAYLVPLVLPQQQVDTTTAAPLNLKPRDKTISNAQQTTSSSSYSFGTKA